MNRRIANGIVATLAALMMIAPQTGHAQTLINRTITIDGDMGDWLTAPAIPASAGQFSTDCGEGEACELDAIQSTGRDLKHFAYTWDNSYLFFFVERYSSASNTNTWLFYLDENVDGRMQTGERVFAVDWQGSNRATESRLCVYAQVGASGDSIKGDGQTLPGSASGCQSIYSGVTGGTLSGLQMESRLSWAALGRSGPTNTAFHISSSRGMNLPSHVEDNMGGPGGGGGGELFPPDLAVAVEASAAEVSNQEAFTLTATLTNVYFDSYTGIGIDITLPPEVDYVSHTAPTGTSFVDSDSDGRPDRWLVAALGSQGEVQLLVQLRGRRIPEAVTADNTVALATWGGTDSEASNNTATVSYTVMPSPEITIAKTASTLTPEPGSVVLYTVLASNPAHALAEQVVVESELGEHLQFSLDSFGAGAPFQFVNGSPSSGLSMGSPEYSNDGGASWTYAPVSGGGGAPAGFDGNVTNWRITMNGTMQTHGAMFEIVYAARVP